VSTTITTETLSAALRAGGVLADDYNAVSKAVWSQDHLPAALLDLSRLRLAQLHGADSELQLRLENGLEAAKIEALLAGNISTGLFSAAELAVLDFTEIYAQDPAAISDDMADAIKRHFGEAGLVCLVEALGFIDGRIRLALMFNALRRTH